jgi:arylsulfatase A-like enzyme
MLGTAVLIAVSAAWRASAEVTTSESKPNVVVVLIDTLRPDYLGIYGHAWESAPFLAKLAETSTVCTRAFSTSSWTAPSTSSVFTSLYPHQHGIIEGFYVHKGRAELLEKVGKQFLPLNAMPKDVSTLPEILKDQGYRTYGLASNINIGDTIGFSRGFDKFELHNDTAASNLLRRLAAWRDEILSEGPHFVYLHFNDVHSPYLRRREHFREATGILAEDRGNYLSEIGYVDANIARAFELLDVDDDTLVVVVSDHGEEFLEHHNTSHGPHLYRELNNVLTLYRGPGLGIATQRLNTNVSLVDVLPTVLEYTSGAMPPDRMGWSLRALLTGGEAAAQAKPRFDERILFAHRYHFLLEQQHHWAAMRGMWKFILMNGTDQHLYNHQDDPAEKHNVVAIHPDIVAPLLAEVERLRAEGIRPQEGSEGVELNESLLDELEALGYVQH